ncbi:MAG: AAA family ATPase [candidate division NC10 bacterium]|nr:AAA family ATPase [candidate division NC10 bacterium]
MSGTATTTLLDAALDYRQMWGAPVVPVNDHKQPLCEWGQWRYGGQTESAVKELFSRPAHGLALLLWPASTLAVMDFDGPHAEQAWRSTGVSVPRTARVYTPHGVHDYFRMPPSVECDEVDRKVRIVTARECGCVKPCGVDLLVKGYALAPPTPRYREDPDYVLEPSRIADLPEGVLALMRHATATGNGERFTIAERIPEGERNTELYKLARSLKARNMSPDAILAALLKENEMKCEPLLPDAEIEKIVAHAYEQPDRPEFAATGGADRQESAAGGAEREKPNDAVIIRLADVQPEPVTWLWPGRVPLGKLTVLDGDPGLGKSTLAFDLAARVSNGSLMPDGSPSLPGGAVILTLEDGLADTVVPRLTVAGADLAKIVALQGVKGADGKLRVPTVEDIAALTCACQQVAAKIVLIDPLMAYLPSQRNSWRDQDVRQALAPLAKMAEENGVAVLVIRHLNKSGGSQSIYRGGGSIGIVGAARMALLVAKDPEN